MELLVRLHHPARHLRRRDFDFQLSNPKESKNNNELS